MKPCSGRSGNGRVGIYMDGLLDKTMPAGVDVSCLSGHLVPKRIRMSSAPANEGSRDNHFSMSFRPSLPPCLALL